MYGTDPNFPHPYRTVKNAGFAFICALIKICVYLRLAFTTPTAKERQVENGYLRMVDNQTTPKNLRLDLGTKLSI